MDIEGVKLEFLGHSGFLITTSSNKKIAIDPYNLSENVIKNIKADLILITHDHYDHCSIKDIEKISKKGTTIIIPADAQSKITKIEGVEIQLIEVGEEFKFGNIRIEAVLAYNIDKEFHPKRAGWLGYIIKLNNVIIYHAGDTDKIPEMKNLSGYGKQDNKFIVLLPVSGKFVMTAEEAAEAASLISPSLAIPMHYGSGVIGTIEDAQKFVELCKKMNINAQILEKI